MKEPAEQLTLLTSCALPGCSAPTVTPGDVCSDCRHAFGDMLIASPSPARDADTVSARLRERDQATMAAYRDQLRTATRTPTSERTTKANQVCWLCTERRTCTQVNGLWECRDCMETA